MGAIERIGHCLAVVSSVLTFSSLVIIFVGPNLPLISPSLCFLEVSKEILRRTNSTKKRIRSTSDKIQRPTWVHGRTCIEFISNRYIQTAMRSRSICTRVQPDIPQLTPSSKIVDQDAYIRSLVLSHCTAQTDTIDLNLSSEQIMPQPRSSPTLGLSKARDSQSPTSRTYLIGLLNICHLTKLPGSDKQCSKLNLLFSSNISTILCRELADGNSDQKNCIKDADHTHPMLSRLSIWAYLTGALMTLLSIVSGIRLIIYCKGSALAIIFTLVSNQGKKKKCIGD